MNYKLLFPTYRTRYRFVRDQVTTLKPCSGFSRTLNVGSGEGDYDPMISTVCQELISCDINPSDVDFARTLNQHIKGLSYRVQSAMGLEFTDGEFDLVVSVDVFEHVEDPRQMLRQISRVMMPGGIAVITFPQTRFPITYDPINYFAGSRLVSLGAYAFGHSSLIDGTDFETWVQEEGMQVLVKKNLSGALIGAMELYWPGILQGLLKANSGNSQKRGGDTRGLRPSSGEPSMVKLTDFLIDLDNRCFQGASNSIGLGYVLRKPHS
ncbi:MAG: class I SAM-dependent methyltransferase [bacterium]|nr:class I SAM-dependent methyltransferase [bacterium]